MSLREAMLYERLEEDRVRCNLCGRRCLVDEGETGFCGVRKNEGGKFYSLVYGKAISACADPVGKKPLLHFNPGSVAMSIATVGCNFQCKFCDNWKISQEEKVKGRKFSPEEVVEAAREHKCQGISYTYTEPTVFFEYAYDTAKLAHQVGLFNTLVTNGYLTPEAVQKISPYLDAATVDFKAGGDPEFYKEFSSVPSVKPVYECLKEMKRNGIHLEITNMIVPREGDAISRIKRMATWIKEALGEDTPFHLLRFHPEYELTDLPSTPLATLKEAYTAAKETGLNYVYVGNCPGHPCESTYCPHCHETVIKRFSFKITRWNLTEEMHCPECGRDIAIEGRLHIEEGNYPNSLF